MSNWRVLASIVSRTCWFRTVPISQTLCGPQFASHFAKCSLRRCHASAFAIARLRLCSLLLLTSCLFIFLLHLEFLQTAHMATAWGAAADSRAVAQHSVDRQCGRSSTASATDAEDECGLGECRRWRHGGGYVDRLRFSRATARAAERYGGLPAASTSVIASARASSSSSNTDIAHCTGWRGRAEGADVHAADDAVYHPARAHSAGRQRHLLSRHHTQRGRRDTRALTGMHFRASELSFSSSHWILISSSNMIHPISKVKLSSRIYYSTKRSRLYNSCARYIMLGDGLRFKWVVYECPFTLQLRFTCIFMMDFILKSILYRAWN